MSEHPRATALYDYNVKYKKILHRLIAADVENRNTVWILDVGCGAGADLLRLSFDHAMVNIVGIDMNYAALQRARQGQREGVRCTFLQANAEQLPFANGIFDTVISSEVFEHLIRPQQLLQECCRVLKENGKIFLTTPSRYNYTRLLGKLFPRGLRDHLRRYIYHYPQGNEGQGDPHVCEYSYGQVKRIFEQNGFLVERILGGVLRVPFWPLFKRFPILVWLWRQLDWLLDIIPGGIHLKLNFIMVGRKTDFNA